MNTSLLCGLPIVAPLVIGLLLLLIHHGTIVRRKRLVRILLGLCCFYITGGAVLFFLGTGQPAVRDGPPLVDLTTRSVILIIGISCGLVGVLYVIKSIVNAK